MQDETEEPMSSCVNLSYEASTREVRAAHSYIGNLRDKICHSEPRTHLETILNGGVTATFFTP
jgi:hypothetical protein